MFWAGTEFAQGLQVRLRSIALVGCETILGVFCIQLYKEMKRLQKEGYELEIVKDEEDNTSQG